MKPIKVEGILLKKIDILKEKKVCTLLTKEEGLLSFIAYAPSKKNLIQLNLISPLSKGDYNLQPGRGELFQYRDGTLLDLHLPIRESWEKMSLSFEFFKMILKTQLPQKPSKDLYLLLSSYLKYLGRCSNLLALKWSFYLKLLKHEGEYSLCSIDSTPQEKVLITRLVNARKFSEIEEIQLPKNFEVVSV
ncbi:MAG: DNA repair protein RecO [Simkaniaceae bacterium]